MAFTALKGLSITAKAQASVSFATPFGQAATHSYSVSPSLTGTAQPSFDIAVLSDKEFTKAIHTPVSAETLGLFLRQGCPARVLLHVFVERLEKPGEVSIENRAKSIEAFAKEVAKIGRNPVVSAGKSSYTQIGLSLSLAELKENRHLLKQMADLGAKKLQLLACDVARRRAGNTSNPNPSPEACPPDEYALFSRSSSLVLSVNRDPTKTEKPNVFGINAAPTATKTTLVLRSLQGMLYYLGENARKPQNDTGAIELPSSWGKPNKCNYWTSEMYRDLTRDRSRILKGCQRLFMVLSNSNKKMAVSVECDGDTYGIPSDSSGGFSMLAMTLVSQIIDLQKDSKTLRGQQKLNVFTAN
jgi:hypothetical protein